MGEPGGGQRQMALEHQREHPLLLLGNRPQGDGAGHVGGALTVMCAGVQQKQARRVQGYVGLRRGIVVDDGTVGTVARDGVEAQVQEVRLLGAEGGQLSGGGQLGNGLLAHMGLDPVQEPAQGRAILNMGGTEVLHLLSGFAGLHENGRAGLIQYRRLGQALHDAVVGGGAVGHDPRPGGQGAQHVIDLAVGPHGHAAGGQLSADVRRDRVCHAASIACINIAVLCDRDHCLPVRLLNRDRVQEVFTCPQSARKDILRKNRRSFRKVPSILKIFRHGKTKRQYIIIFIHIYPAALSGRLPKRAFLTGTCRKHIFYRQHGRQ